MIGNEQEVTARGLPPELWRPLLGRLPTLAPADPSSITVVVPHPDDETLGCGGLLHRLSHTTAAPVSVVFVTDGAAGYPGCSPAQAAELITVRRAEARTALRMLGLGDATGLFLDVADGQVGAVETELTVRLAAVLLGAAGGAGAGTGGGGGLCLAPWPQDPHPDHQAVGRAALVAARLAGIELWQYPIWMRHSIRPDDPIVNAARLRVLRLSPAEQAAKRMAIETHDSQLRAPFPGFGPVLPEHVLELFADGLEPFFLPAERVIA
jgi:LmbE family N-acetylglucosaminyl deacetylase